MSEERPDPPTADVTGLLADIAGGDADAAERVWSALYDDLRRLARRHLDGERAGHTLDPTALVHEAWMRLRPEHAGKAASRGQYVALAARVMRSLLVDHARRRKAAKRDAGGERVTLSGIDAAPQDVEILVLHDALEKLSAVDAELGRIAELHVFGGLTQPEVAAALGLAQRTLERRWRVASTWLRRELGA